MNSLQLFRWRQGGIWAKHDGSWYRADARGYIRGPTENSYFSCHYTFKGNEKVENYEEANMSTRNGNRRGMIGTAIGAALLGIVPYVMMHFVKAGEMGAPTAVSTSMLIGVLVGAAIQWWVSKKVV